MRKTKLLLLVLPLVMSGCTPKATTTRHNPIPILNKALATAKKKNQSFVNVDDTLSQEGSEFAKIGSHGGGYIVTSYSLYDGTKVNAREYMENNFDESSFTYKYEENYNNERANDEYDRPYLKWNLIEEETAVYRLLCFNEDYENDIETQYDYKYAYYLEHPYYGLHYLCNGTGYITTLTGDNFFTSAKMTLTYNEAGQIINIAYPNIKRCDVINANTYLIDNVWYEARELPNKTVIVAHYPSEEYRNIVYGSVYWDNQFANEFVDNFNDLLNPPPNYYPAYNYDIHFPITDDDKMVANYFNGRSDYLKLNYRECEFSWDLDKGDSFEACYYWCLKQYWTKKLNERKA